LLLLARRYTHDAVGVLLGVREPDGVLLDVAFALWLRLPAALCDSVVRDGVPLGEEERVRERVAVAVLD
jgi:hypothetical protein